MISEKEQARIRLLSDTELYQQAVEFTRSIGGALPGSQINGLLNVALANTYAQLEEFVRRQYGRSTWRANERHIPDFYRRLEHKLKELERTAASVTRERQTKPAPEEVQTLKMLLAREFIQHVLAENAYQGAQRSSRQPQERGAPQQQAHRGSQQHQPGRSPQQQQRAEGKHPGNNRGPATR